MFWKVLRWAGTVVVLVLVVLAVLSGDKGQPQQDQPQQGQPEQHPAETQSKKFNL